MAISTDSEEWENGHRFDWTAVHVRSILSEDTALTLDEIAEEILERKSEIIPRTIREDESAFKAHLYRVLERQSRRNLVEDRVVTEQDGATEVYYADSGESGIFPLAEIVDVFPERFTKIEENIDSTDADLADLDERLSQLEYQFRQKHR